MNYHNITKDDMLNGDGLRTVLWVSGCTQKCYNCQNPQTWDFNSGIPFTEETMTELLNDLSKDYISGLTFSGGHPLEKQNLDCVTYIAKTVKKLYPNKTIWLYTGYLWEEVKDLEIIKYLDVIVDRKYVDSQRDVTLAWRGSSNQRVIDVQKSLADNTVRLYCE